VAITAISLTYLAITGDQYFLAALSIVVAGSTLGFLIWNRAPARIYMGDAGALFLGLLIATLTVRFKPSTDNSTSSFAIPVLLLAIPILDTTVAVFSRLRRKLSPFQGASIYGSPFYNGNNCTHVILRYPAQNFSWKNSDIFMGKDDIPAVFSFLLENGYEINTDLTKMLFDSRIDMGGIADRRLSGDRKMICIITNKHEN
jgi:UDP-N-acetylmuramyl pentapeptide phosphotransferase/UDP-N-acetylglucosamine-1-phosphate transferase